MPTFVLNFPSSVGQVQRFLKDEYDDDDDEVESIASTCKSAHALLLHATRTQSRTSS